MVTRRIVLVSYVLVLVAKVASLLWSMTQLPERVATHFSGDGGADGWMGRTDSLLGEPG